MWDFEVFRILISDDHADRQFVVNNDKLRGFTLIHKSNEDYHSRAFAAKLFFSYLSMHPNILTVGESLFYSVLASLYMMCTYNLRLNIAQKCNLAPSSQECDLYDCMHVN